MIMITDNRWKCPVCGRYRIAKRSKNDIKKCPVCGFKVRVKMGLARVTRLVPVIESATEIIALDGETPKSMKGE